MSDTLERLQTALHDAYAVDRQIGEGGMATVFLAEDLKHHRKVAIKVLRPELSATLGSERFLLEIQMAARLQHPLIVPVYDSGTADGLLYYVMPFVEGESLRDLLQRDKRLPLERAAEIVRDVASGLAYANQQGVVHRDIKPENIMLSDGHALVADFGVARAVDAARSENQSLTGTGMAIGTPAYMSPEQATAEPVDGRSDEYALACVFYEMVSGSQPFSAPTMQALLTKVLTAPRPLLSLVAHTPQPLDAVVQRALAQDAAARYPDVNAFARAVVQESTGIAAVTRESRRWRRRAVILPALVTIIALVWVMLSRPSGVVVAGAEAMAVMPFSTSGDKVASLGEGMVDLLSGSLDGVGGIHTVEARQVLQALGRRGRHDVPDLSASIAVARSLKAASVLMGSIVATGADARLTADLYDLTGKRLAHASVDGSSDSVLALADGLALSVLHDIWRSREPLPSARSLAITSKSMPAIRAYLDGEQWIRHGQWDSAQSAFQRAVDADSTFALAWYKLANAMGWQGQVTTVPAHTAALNAVKYSKGLPTRLHNIMVAYELFQRGRPEAVDSMQAYTAAYPDDADGWDLLGEAQYHTSGYHARTPAELIAPFDRVLALDSTLTPAAIHPVEIAIAARDTTLAKRYLKVFKDGGASEEAGATSEALAILHGADTGYKHFAGIGSASIGQAVVIAQTLSPAMTGTDFVHFVRSYIGQVVPGNREQLLGQSGAVAGALGRQADARALADTVRTLGNSDLASIAMLAPIYGGFALQDNIDRINGSLDKAAPNNAYADYLRALTALDADKPAVAATAIQAALALPDTAVPAWLRSVLIGLDGVRMIAAGDTARGLARADSGLRAAGGFANANFTGPVELRVALALAARPVSRADGIRQLRYGFSNQLMLLPIIQDYLGKAYEAAGQRSDAIAAYGQFLRLWDRADPDYQPRVQEAKDALKRLTAEGAK
ncbi:MAG TPA: protein kinase [Gemmatimonadales bacterium]|jgi:serine/threonine-protein kinase|nr:protein kinase [Gemmatimonadales bacterium]